mgnify:CR=1 FL=1
MSNLAQSHISKFLTEDLIKGHQKKLSAGAPPKDLVDKLSSSIVKNLSLNNSTLIAHYYTDPWIQKLAEETGGMVGDSLEMAKFGYKSKANNLIVVGVKFMAETAKILSPKKSVFVPTKDATCSLDLGCPENEFKEFISKHPDREVVVYANTSAKVKALSDWVVTSSIAKEVIDQLDADGKKILWAPDKYLGSYLQKETGADMILWNSACVVHEEFKSKALKDLKIIHPDAGILVHPEAPEDVINMADAVGSTSQLIKAAKDLNYNKLIVATDKSIFYKMQMAAPGKELIEAPTGGASSSCKSCAHCPWMALNSLENLHECVLSLHNEINLDDELIDKAKKPLDRMLNFNAYDNTFTQRKSL